MEGRDPGNGKEEGTRSQSDGGLYEKKNEKATANMVMVVTTKSKVLKEVVFQYKEPFKRKEPKD
jgi:hypothetical protein